MKKATNPVNRILSRGARVRAILVVTVLVFTAGMFQARGEKDRKTEPNALDKMRVGGSILQNSSVSLTASLGSGDFFVNLKRKKTPAGYEFTKKSQFVTLFPQKLKVEINIGGSYLSSPSIGKLSEVDFRAEWKRGDALRPVSSLSAESGQRPFLETTVGIWHLLTIQDNDVPLTDVLVVTMFKDGDTLATFTSTLLVDNP